METIVNQLIYFSFFQSVFLLGIYLLSSESRKNINGYLAAFVVVLAIGLSGRVLYLSGLFGDDFRLVIISEFATLLFGATIYLFTRSSLLGTRFQKKDLLHYIPALIYNSFVYYVFIIRDVATEYWLIMVFLGIGLTFNISYWLLSLRCFISFKKEIKNELSYTVKSQFFLNFLVAVGIGMGFWLTMYVLSLVGISTVTRVGWSLVWFNIAILILFIAYYGIKEPDLYKVAALSGTKKYAQSKFTEQELDQLKYKLDQLMQEKKPYLNRKLLKRELAALLGVSNPEIARLLNERIGMNFFEYINYHRIKEFLELAKSEKGKELTLFGLAQEAGFNSKTTFNKSFKALMGTTPKDYFSKK